MSKNSEDIDKFVDLVVRNTLNDAPLGALLVTDDAAVAKLRSRIRQRAIKMVRDGGDLSAAIAAAEQHASKTKGN